MMKFVVPLITALVLSGCLTPERECRVTVPENMVFTDPEDGIVRLVDAVTYRVGDHCLTIGAGYGTDGMTLPAVVTSLMGWTVGPLGPAHLRADLLHDTLSAGKWMGEEDTHHAYYCALREIDYPRYKAVIIYQLLVEYGHPWWIGIPQEITDQTREQCVWE